MKTQMRNWRRWWAALALIGLYVLAASDDSAAADSEPAEAEPETDVWDNFAPHEPLYFLFGAGPADAKIQFSLRYRIVDGDTDMPAELAWIKKFHIAYTQTTFWDLSEDSLPFTDNTFNPELVYMTRLSDAGETGTGPAIQLNAGLSHESNGKGGADSRSFNTLYVEPEFEWGRIPDLQFALAPRARLYLGKLSGNPDIDRYRGHVSLAARLGWRDGLQATALGRVGDDLDKSSVQIDVSYPVSRIVGHGLTFYLHTQLFTGYGENLLRYDQKVTRLRFGLSLVR